MADLMTIITVDGGVAYHNEIVPQDPIEQCAMATRISRSGVWYDDGVDNKSYLPPHRIHCIVFGPDRRN